MDIQKVNKKENILKVYLLMNTGKRAIIEWGILVFLAFLSFYFSILPIPFSKYCLGTGIVIFIIGVVIHVLSHIHHKQAHNSSAEIDRIITEGIYSKIRHPGYLGIILNYLGFSLWWGSLIPVIIAIFFSISSVLTALEEEKYLLEKFRREYEKYLKEVKWRFIPGIF